MCRLSILTIFLLITTSCTEVRKEKIAASDEPQQQAGFIHLTKEQLVQLGIFVKDSAVMYNNEVADVGGLNIIIRGTRYIGNAATTEQTNFNFYPRYITTTDTIQRAMYRLEGEHPNDMVEASKWSSFENLVPVVVEQKEGEKVFGETLVFWLTKTPDLEKKLKEFK